MSRVSIKSSRNKNTSKSKPMSSNNGRPKPMVPKAGVTVHRSRYGCGGAA